MTLRGAALGLVIVVLAGCAARPPPVTAPMVPADLENWDLTGRISVSTPSDGFTGRFTWRQTPDRIKLDLRGPLGVGGMTIEGDARELTLRRRDDVTILSDPEPDLARLVGWELPVTSLDAWLLGRLDPDYSGSVMAGKDGLASSLQQRGWQADYSIWQTQQGFALPRKLNLTTSELEVRVVIDRFTPH